MSTYEIKEMSGSIGKNYGKKKDTHPDINGKCKINGVEYEIAGWQKTSKKGNSFYSLQFSVPRQKTTVETSDPNDDIPF